MIFRRRASREPDEPPEDEEDVLEELDSPRPRGPWDRTETDADADDETYLDLGGLVVKSRPDLELRLQVDEASGLIASVMLAGRESGLELRAFAAPRSGGIWDDVRKDLAAEAARHGGTATEVDGEFGVEVRLMVSVQGPDGRAATQQSRIVGVEGPRWLLRGTFLGRSAVEPDPEGDVESAFRDVIVVRGGAPMAPRDLIAMQMPASAREAIAAQGAVEDIDDDAGENDEWDDETDETDER